jgi:hypothetical protein
LPTASIVVMARAPTALIGQNAGAHRLAVEMHGACAALRNAAAELGAGHPQNVTQHPQERHVVGNID